MYYGRWSHTLVILNVDALYLAINDGGALKGGSWLADDGRHGEVDRNVLSAIEGSLLQRMVKQVRAQEWAHIPAVFAISKTLQKPR